MICEENRSKATSRGFILSEVVVKRHEVAFDSNWWLYNKWCLDLSRNCVSNLICEEADAKKHHIDLYYLKLLSSGTKWHLTATDVYTISDAFNFKGIASAIWFASKADAKQHHTDLYFTTGFVIKCVTNLVIFFFFINFFKPLLCNIKFTVYISSYRLLKGNFVFY